MITEVTTAPFDYGELDPEVRISLKERANRIGERTRRVVADIWENGREFHEAQKELAAYGNGRFLAWVELETGYSKNTAYNFIRLYQAFDRTTVVQTGIPAKALYLLAAPSTPDDARQEAIDRAQNGEVINYSRAREIVMEKRPEPPRTEPRAAWELQNDMMALLIRWPEAERPQIAQDWQQQEAAAPFWTEMIQSLPKPWQWADVRKALAGLVDFLQRHTSDPVKAEANGAAAPAVVEWASIVTIADWVAEWAKRVKATHTDLEMMLEVPFHVGWNDLRPYIDQRATSKLLRAHPQEVKNAVRDVHRQMLEASKAAKTTPTSPAPIEITIQLRNAASASIHAGPKADAVIHKVFFYNSRPHVATFAAFQPDGREEYEVYELVNLHSYPSPNAIEGTYSGLPVSYVGHSYRLGNPKRFNYQPPAEGEDVDPWELLAEKLAALDADSRADLTELLTSTAAGLSEANPAAAEVVAAVVALVMATVPAEADGGISA